MNNLMIGVGCLLGILFGGLIALYLILTFICWAGDVFDKTTWRWKK